MSTSVEDLYRQASDLSADDRAELAGMLLQSLEDARDPDAEEAWAREIERRMAEYRAGRVRLIPWSEVRAHLHRSNR
ncbi:MAG TPA: addiction module protein [Thermoanaerobaculia bacterium]|nr:addiction module protein [Thermoanaerobaculia bacterium]